MTFEDWVMPLSIAEHELAKAAWNAAAKAEREKCAKVCEELPANDPEGQWFNDDMSLASMECARAIRAMED